MKVWITGIAGFLGSHLADTLVRGGYEVFGNDSLICGDVSNYDKFAMLDCCHQISMVTQLRQFAPDVLVHCAATAHEGFSSFSPSFITRNIYEASVATFSAAIAAGVKRIVFMSSMSRYGDNVPPFTEDMRPRPVDPYAVAKVAAEDTLRILCETHGVAWSVLVPHNIIGPRQRYTDPYRNVASIMINRCLQGKGPVIYGDGMQTRCFSPIEDCLPSIVRAVNGEADGEVVNIGPDDYEITILDLAGRVSALTGYDGPYEFFPDRPNEVKHAYCSSMKARKLLKYQQQNHLDNCLRDMVRHIQQHGIKPFDYRFPLEIINDRTPKTWLERKI